MSTTGIQMLASKRNQDSEKWLIPRLWLGNLQDEPRTPCVKKQERAQKMMETCQKHTEAITQRFPMVKYGTIIGSEIIIILIERTENQYHTDINK